MEINITIKFPFYCLMIEIKMQNEIEIQFYGFEEEKFRLV